MESKVFVDWKVSDVLRIKNKYGYRVTLIYADGTEQIQQKSGFKTERECKKARDVTYGKLFSGTYIVDEGIRLKAFLQKWMDTVIIKKKANTYDGYASTLKLHIYPKLGNIKVSELTKGHLTAFYSDMCQYSYSVADKCRVILKTSLRYAVSMKLIPESPAEKLLLPKKEKKAKYHTISINKEQTLSVEQLKILLDKSKGTRIYLYILFACLMGMRKSEIRGLKYTDIDYARQTIAVQRQLGKDYSKDQSALDPKTVTKQEIEPKTISSTRILDIPDIVFNAIMEERKQYEANRRRRPKEFQDLDFIICSSYGRPRSATYASALYKKILRENSLPDIRFHDLRHTYATLLLSENIDLKAISNSLGHAKSIISVDVYGDHRRIIADGVKEIIPFINEVLPADVLKRFEDQGAETADNFDTDVCFPQKLAEEIVADALHKCA